MKIFIYQNLNISRFLLLLACLFLITTCKDNSNSSLNYKVNLTLHSSSQIKTDTLYVNELFSNQSLAKVSPNKNVRVTIERPTIASIYSKNLKASYLSVLTKGKDIDIFIQPDSTLHTQSKSDSLINYLWQSQNEFIKQNHSLIFSDLHNDSIPVIFENFKVERNENIIKLRNRLNEDEEDLLLFQNYARIYNFLFILGRNFKSFNPTDPYYDFISNIPAPTQALKTLPDVYLYKFDIEFSRSNDSLNHIYDFLRFIETQSEDADLVNFLKASYISKLIESPTDWTEHIQLLDFKVLDQVLRDEKANPYYSIIEEPISTYHNPQNGETAYLFDAEDRMGQPFNLEDLSGKVIFIDVWATWCGPCLSHRKTVLEFAKHYEDNEDVAILLISIDDSKEKWLSFLQKEDASYGLNLFIKNGLNQEFGQRYNIKAIPRYILIGKDGKLIDLNIEEPSIKVKKMIEKALLEPALKSH